MIKFKNQAVQKEVRIAFPEMKSSEEEVQTWTEVICTKRKDRTALTEAFSASINCQHILIEKHPLSK